MTSNAKRLFQNWELDIVEAKQKFEARVRQQLNDFERRMLKNSGLEVIDDAQAEREEELKRRSSSDIVNTKDGDSEDTKDGDTDRKVVTIDKKTEKPPQRPRKVIGRVHIRIKSMVAEKLGDTKAYFEVQIEDEKFTSPVAFKQAGKSFVWEIGGRFPITDITGGFVCTVWSKNLLKTGDTLLGRVWIPLTNLDAKVDKDGNVETVGTAAYALFPVRTRTVRAIPGHRRAMDTAMDRNEFNDKLQLTVEHSLVLDEAYRFGDSVWPLYYINAGYLHLMPQVKTGPLKSLASSPQAILDSVSDLKRNGARIGSAVKAISESVPVLIAGYILSWENPLASATAAGTALLFARYVTAPMIPLVFFGFFVASSIAARQPLEGKRSSWAMWNDEIDLDPELSLTPLQRYARVVQKIEEIAGMLNNVACIFEKIINLSNFSDPNATRAAFMVLFIAASLLGFAISFARFFNFSFPGLCIFMWIITPLFTSSQSSKERIWWLENALIGVYNRVPSNDDLGARWVSDEQRTFFTRKAEEEERERARLQNAKNDEEVESKGSNDDKEVLPSVAPNEQGSVAGEADNNTQDPCEGDKGFIKSLRRRKTSGNSTKTIVAETDAESTT